MKRFFRGSNGYVREIIYFDDYERIVKGNDVTEQYFLDNDVLLIKKDGILSPYKFTEIIRTNR